MSRTPLLLVLITCLAISANMAAACGSGDGRRSQLTPIDPPLTVEDLHQRMLAAMSRTDKILHTTLDTNVDQGPYSYAGTWEAWIEPERNRARVSIRSGLGTTSSELRATEIILDEDIYANESGGRTHKRKALTCRGTDDPILSIMLGCQGALEESNTTLQTSARYQDRAVLALVTVGTSRGEDESWIFTDTLYVDPLTYLPIAQEQTGTLDIGEKYPVKGTTRFTNEFVAADSQPPDLFDPVAIGYVELTPTPSTD